MNFGEIGVILIVALLVIGPKKLPDMAKSIGKGYAEFRRAFNDFKKSVDLTDTGTANKGSSKSASAPKDTYKSRWEEQIVAPDEVKSDEPKQADAQPEPAEEEKKPEAPARAKRSDLVKEDEEDGNNG